MTNQAEIISDETVREIASLYPQAARAIDDDTPPEVAAMLTHVPALCATVKHLRAEVKALTKERDDLRSEVEAHRYMKMFTDTHVGDD